MIYKCARRIQFVVASLLACSGGLLCNFAYADIYHAVQPGETIDGIAARFHVSAEAIIAANHLEETRHDAALPAMLMLIPDKPADKAADKAPGLANQKEAIKEAIRENSPDPRIVSLK